MNTPIEVTYYPSYPVPTMTTPGVYVGAYQPAPTGVIAVITFGEPLTEDQVKQAASAVRCAGALRMHFSTWEQFSKAHGL